MNAEQDMVDTFAAIELSHAALYGLAAKSTEEAKAAIAARYMALHLSDIIEFQCNLKTEWEQTIFLSLAKRYGIKTYRYRKQRKSTFLLRCTEPFMNDLLWPIFRGVMAKLRERFHQVVNGFQPSIAAGPFGITVFDHDHDAYHLCEECSKRLAEQK